MTSVEIEQLREQEDDEQRVRAVYVLGTFGPSPADLPALPTMSARYHLLSELEQDVEGIRDRLELAGEQALLDELFRFREYLSEQMAAESDDKEGTAA